MCGLLFEVESHHCGTYPEFVFMIKCIKQLDDVAVVTLSQDVNLNYVVLQLLLTFCLDHFGCSQGSRLLVTGLRDKNMTCMRLLGFYFFYFCFFYRILVFLGLNICQSESKFKAFFRI